MKSESASAPRIAVIGCGAIAESFHLPALVRQPGVRERLVLADPNPARVEMLAGKFGVERAVADVTEVLGEIDGAVITVPHRLHYPIASECVTAGVHVLVEKPLCGSVEEGRSLLAAAEQAGTAVAVNNMRRIYPAMRYMKQLIDDGEVGAILSVDVEEGEPFEWPAASGAYFGAAAGGHGIVLDRGAHVFDLICWWLGGEPDLTQCLDDARGGTEATAHVTFSHGPVSGTVKLSWLSKLRNTLRVEGERGTLEVAIYDWDSVWLERDGRRRRIPAPTEGLKVSQLSYTMLSNFVAVVRGAAQPRVSGADVLDSIAMMQAYYSMRSLLDMPWYDTFQRLSHV